MSDVIELIYSKDGSRRIALFQRADGTFGFREESHYTNDFDKDNVFEGWASLPPPCVVLRLSRNRQARGNLRRLTAS